MPRNARNLLFGRGAWGCRLGDRRRGEGSSPAASPTRGRGLRGKERAKEVSLIRPAGRPASRLSLRSSLSRSARLGASAGRSPPRKAAPGCPKGWESSFSEGGNILASVVHPIALKSIKCEWRRFFCGGRRRAGFRRSRGPGCSRRRGGFPVDSRRAFCHGGRARRDCGFC